MSPDQIAQAVNYFQGKATANAATVASAKSYNTNPGPSIQRASNVSPSQPGTGGSGGSRNAGSPGLAPGANDIVNNIIRWGVGPLGWAVTAGHDGKGGTSVVDDALASTDAQGTPVNFTQKVLNALSTGGYAVNEGLHGILQANDASQKAVTAAGSRGDVGGVVSALAGGAGEGIKAGLGGIAKGVAEGAAGLRFGDRPYTASRNLEDLGVSQAIKDTVKNTTGADAGWQNAAAGAVGFAGDVATDPLSYATGTGLLKGLHGGLQAASDSTRAGEGVLAAAKAGARGAADGHAQAFADMAAAKASKTAAAAAKKSGNVPTVGLAGEQAAAAAARADHVAGRTPAPAPDPAAEWLATHPADVPHAATDAQIPATDVPHSTTDAPIPATNVHLTPEATAALKDPAAADLLKPAPVTHPNAANFAPAADQAAAGADASRQLLADRGQWIQKLLPNLGTPAREVPGAKILQGSVVPGATAGGATPELAAAVRGVIQNTATVKDIAPAIKAVKAMPGGPELLAQKLTVAGKPITLGGALDTATVRQLTDPGRAGDHIAAIEQALAGTPGKAGRPTPDSLTQSIAQAGFTAPPDTQALLHGLLTAKTPAARQQILQGALGGGTKFKDFPAAMKAAADGQVESSMMRSMLDALGVKTLPKTNLKQALAGKGTLQWEKIRDNVPTAQEVLDGHGIPAEASDAAKAIDPAAVSAEAASQAQEALGAAQAVDAATIVDGHTSSLTTEAISRGLKKLAQPKPDATTETLTHTVGAWNALHTTVIGALKSAMNLKELVTTERGLFGAERYLPAMRFLEAHQRSIGDYTYLQNGANQTPLYLGVGQILDLLPPNVTGDFLFNLDYRLTEKGAGNTAAARELFKQGLSGYPTTLGDGARAAIETGGNLDAIRTAMSDGRSAFEKLPEAAQVLDQVALHMSTPEFVTAATGLHETQRVAAVAVAQHAAGDVVDPIAQRIISAVDSPVTVDRSIILNATHDLAAATDTMDAGLAQDIAKQRATTGTVGTLGPIGLALARHDAKQLEKLGTEAARVADIRAANLRKMGLKTADGRPVMPVIPTDVSTLERGTLNATAEHGAQFLRDTAQQTKEAVQTGLDLGYYEEADLFNGAAITDQTIQNALGRFMAGFAHHMGSQTGMNDGLKTLQMGISEEGMTSSLALEKDIRGLIYDQRTGAAGLGQLSTKSTGILDGVTTLLGHKPSNDEINGLVSEWWTAMAAHGNTALAGGARLTPDEMHAALLRGQDGLYGNQAFGARALTEEEAGMAMQLHGLLERVFGGAGGPMERLGVSSADMMRALNRQGFGPGGKFAGLTPDVSKGVPSLAGHWMTMEAGDLTDPLDVLNNWQKAMHAASVKPALAQAMAARFDHHALALAGDNRSVAQLYKEGWRKVDTAGKDSGVGAYLPKDSLFPPEQLRALKYVNRYFDDASSGVNKNWQWLWDHTDPIVRVWKPLVTSLNPRHHVGNILGDSAMTAADGIHPLYGAKATLAMHAANAIPAEADVAGLARDVAASAGPGRAVKSTFLSPDTTITLRDGKGGFRQVTMTAQETYDWAISHGVYVNAHQATDTIGNTRGGILRGKYADFMHHPLNAPAAGMRGLGRFSAARDNLPRAAHFLGALEDGTYASLDAALQSAAGRVYKFHPTIANLTTFEARYARRAFAFYTWQRAALGAMATVMVEHPAAATLYSKGQYSMAESAGFNPESYGKPTGDDPRIPSYEANGTYGPTFSGGLSPFGGVADGAAPQQWGVALSAPALDTMNALFAGTNDTTTGGPGLGLARSVGASLNPLIVMPLETVFNFNASGIGKAPSADYGNFLLSNTGLPYAVSGMTGGQENKNLSPEEAAGDVQRKQLNWATGLKFTNYTNATATKIASTESGAAFKAKLVGNGLPDTIIKKIVAKRSALIKSGAIQP